MVIDVNNLIRMKSTLSARNYHILAFQHIENLLKILIREQTGKISRVHTLDVLWFQVVRLYDGSKEFVENEVSQPIDFLKLLGTNFLDIRYVTNIRSIGLASRDTYIEVLRALLNICVLYKVV